jgi:uncharacterized protein YndB with AHSA1/START domain
MAGGRSETVITASDREIVLTRTFDAPRELVWRAWTDPAQVVKWWGPFGFTTTTESMDVRPGGQWQHTMHGPDGTEYPNTSVYVEVVQPERLVYRHGGGSVDGPDVRFECIVTFERVGGATRVTIRHVFPSKAARDAAIREYGALDGGHQHLARLDEHLSIMASEIAGRPVERNLTITRVFDAPRALVWRAWTEPALLMRWWGPRGYTLPHCTVDLRVGGSWQYCMRSLEGRDFWCRGTYLEIVEPERLVTSDYFCDAQGTRISPASVGMPERMPDDMVLTTTFTELKGRTTVTIHQSIPESIAKRCGAPEGWNQSFDKLGELLADS